MCCRCRGNRRIDISFTTSRKHEKTREAATLDTWDTVSCENLRDGGRGGRAAVNRMLTFIDEGHELRLIAGLTQPMLEGLNARASASCAIPGLAARFTARFAYRQHESRLARRYGRLESRSMRRGGG